MAKNKDTSFETMRDLQEEQKKLQKKMGKIMIPCSHTKDNGKLKVDFLGDTKVRCKRCGAIFDFRVIKKEELKSAIETIHNALNQVKALSSDPEREQGIIRELGSIDYNLKEFVELYERTQDIYGKGNGKKKKNKGGYNDDFGSFGANNIDFIGGKNKYRY